MSLIAARDVTNDNLLHEVALLRQRGSRLVTLTCLQAPEGHEILYHFDERYEMSHLRLRLPSGESLCSISSIYPAAMIAENEIKDFFGLSIAGLSVDFQGRLLLTEDAPRAPMNTRCGMGIDARRPAAAAAGGGPGGEN